MKSKIINLILIISSLFGYLEWGESQQQFLFQVEAELFSKLISEPASLLHPFVLLPLAGQILLIITLFQEQPSKLLTYLSIAGLGLLFAMILFIGIINSNIKIGLSALPFLITSVYAIFHYRKLNKKG